VDSRNKRALYNIAGTMPGEKQRKSPRKDLRENTSRSWVHVNAGNEMRQYFGNSSLDPTTMNKNGRKSVLQQNRGIKRRK
jgi:hypothetical protein